MTLKIDGREYKPLQKRIKVQFGKDWREADLYELVCSSILPQYFARFDDGTMRDLRNDCYALIIE